MILRWIPLITCYQAGIALGISLANAGGLVGSNIFLESEDPMYWTGYGLSLGFVVIAIGSTFVLRSAYKRANAKRDAVTLKPQLSRIILWPVPHSFAAVSVRIISEFRRKLHSFIHEQRPAGVIDLICNIVGTPRTSQDNNEGPYSSQFDQRLDIASLHTSECHAPYYGIRTNSSNIKDSNGY